MYRFEYVLDDKDYYVFNKFHLSDSSASKITIMILRMLGPALNIIIFLANLKYYIEDELLVESIIMYAIISAIFFFSIKPFCKLIIKIQLRLMKKDGKLPYGKNIIIRFDESFFIETSNDTKTETKMNYTNIEKILISNNMIYIYVTAMSAFIIPFSVFKTEEQRRTFLTFIKSKAGIANPADKRNKFTKSK